LKKGEMSEPIKSTVGYHIIKMEDRHPFESYEFHHDNILKFLEQRGIKEASANALIDSVAKKEGVSRDVIIGRYYDDLISKDSDSKNLAQEYYDGTLMYEISKNQIWDVAAKDEEGLAKYFKANKKKYAFDEPRFRGLILHGKDDAVIATAKKLVKGVKEEDWPTTIVKGLNNDSVKVIRVEHGIYKKGDSKTVDNMVFNTGTEYKPMKDYPATDVFGKKLKKPETYKDVKGQVTTDYQQECEKAWVEGLRKKYPVDIDESVLATVNKH
jgi:peptidyl-prolyl cis-trans isomerase SurA